MQRPRPLLVLVPVLVLVYLLVLKRHCNSQEALPLRTPGPAPRGPLLVSDWMIRYAVIFDAGRNGTRVHIFKLRLFQDQTGTQTGVPQLLDETFKAIKPGLSAFAEDPPQSRAGLEQLLDLAQSTIPVWFHNSTPVFLKATAGPRLLQEEKAERLLDQVRALFQSCSFVSTDDSVSILDGADEGISAWLTVNFLLGTVGGAASSVGMLDLGGGSTQVTFEPGPQFQDPSMSDSIHKVHLFNRNYSLYTHIYLGLGLMSIRDQVLTTPPGGAVLVSPCLSPNATTTWPGTGPMFSSCVDHVLSVLNGRVRQVEPRLFYASSYYYERALEAGVQDGEEGVVSVEDYRTAAQRVCSDKDPSPDQSPFLCLDLVYISVLLQELGLSPGSRLELVQKIQGVETSRALGAIFSLMKL